MADVVCEKKSNTGSRVFHGHAALETPEYVAWSSMKKRCLNPNVDSASRYSGRGIRVCSGWKESFTSFLNDMGFRPEGMSCDRMKNDLHYSCGHCEECIREGWELNCKWSTAKEQQRNMSRNRHITIGDKTMLLIEWVEFTGVSLGTIGSRLSRGWPEHEAVFGRGYRVENV